MLPKAESIPPPPSRRVNSRQTKNDLPASRRFFSLPLPPLARNPLYRNVRWKRGVHKTRLHLGRDTLVLSPGDNAPLCVSERLAVRDEGCNGRV